MNVKLGLVQVSTLYTVECFDREGKLKWREEIHNLIVTEGLNHILDVVLDSGTQVTSWFVGLIDNAGFSAIAAADVMNSHAGWTESVVYSEATRVAYVPASASGGSMTNVASKAAFSINGTATLHGAFLVSNSTKSGTTGVLYGAAAFTTPRGVESADTVQVTLVASLTSS